VVKSKYSFYTYAGVFLGIATIILLIIFSTTINLGEYSKKVPLPKSVGVFICILLIVYMLYRVFKTSPQLEISQDKLKVYGILHKEKEISVNDVSEIDLFSIGMYNGSATIVTNIHLLTGKTIKLASPNYKNMPELKLAFIQYFSEKIKKTNPSPKKSVENSNMEFEYIKFSGNPYTSINGILIFGFAIGMIITISKRGFEPAHLFLILPIIGIFFALSYQLHYFIFSGKELIVRNHFLPWINKQYAISDILVLNFEQARKGSRSLRISTKDYKSRSYPAGSLRDKHWDAMKEKIVGLGINFIK
jgi:hypothetical protein